jgi:two-component system nitrogen regulation response regulator GlnG
LDDVPDLARHFLREAERGGLPFRRLDAEAMERLQHYTWPGNVRELENLVRRLVVLTADETIAAADIDAELSLPRQAGNGAANLSETIECHLNELFAAATNCDLPPAGLYDRVLADVERPLLALTLAAVQGNQIKASRILGMNRNTLRKKIRERGIGVVKGQRIA